MDEITYRRAFEFVEVIRGMIRHEDTLMNHRLAWMWALQGFLFGAVGLLWKERTLAVLVISIVGVVSCVSIGYSTNRGLRAIKDLLGICRKFKESIPGDYQLPPTIGSRKKANEWLLPARALPSIFGTSWVLIFAIRLFSL